MTKTPEELTKEWKAGELEDGLYYILLENGKTPISELETWYRTNIEESKEYYETEQAFYGYDCVRNACDIHKAEIKRESLTIMRGNNE